MIKPPRWATALALTLWAAALFAQTEPVETTETPAQPTIQKPNETAKKPAGGASTPSEVPAKKNNDSPFDYRSSEEISEDLSVSFPVDI